MGQPGHDEIFCEDGGVVANPMGVATPIVVAFRRNERIDGLGPASCIRVERLQAGLGCPVVKGRFEDRAGLVSLAFGQHPKRANEASRPLRSVTQRGERKVDTSGATIPFGGRDPLEAVTAGPCGYFELHGVRPPPVRFDRFL